MVSKGQYCVPAPVNRSCLSKHVEAFGTLHFLLIQWSFPFLKCSKHTSHQSDWAPPTLVTTFVPASTSHGVTSEPYPCVVLKVSRHVTGYQAVLAFQFIGGGGVGGTLTSLGCVGGSLQTGAEVIHSGFLRTGEFWKVFFNSIGFKDIASEFARCSHLPGEFSSDHIHAREWRLARKNTLTRIHELCTRKGGCHHMQIMSHLQKNPSVTRHSCLLGSR